MINKSDPENLIEDPNEAQFIWEQIISAIRKAERTDLLQNPTVLDLGGRAGEFSKQLAKQGIKSVSLDKEHTGTNKGANQVRANAYKMPFPSGSFDIIHSNSLFDAMYNLDYAQLLPEIVRVLKPNGILSVFAPRPLPTKEIEEHFKLMVSEGQDALTLWRKK